MRYRRLKFASKIYRYIVIEIQGLNQKDNAKIKTDIHTGTGTHTHTYISDHQCLKLKGDSEFR